MIEKELYTKIVEEMPILCVDIVVEDARGNYLVLYRANEPLKGEWWVPGGRIKKNELAQDAVERKLHEETGLKARAFKFLGFYEGIFDKAAFGSKGTHSVSLVFSVVLDSVKPEIYLDGQSSYYDWVTELPEKFIITYE